MSEAPDIWGDIYLPETINYKPTDELVRLQQIWRPNVDKFRPQGFVNGLQATRREWIQSQAAITFAFEDIVLAGAAKKEEDFSSDPFIQNIIIQTTTALFEICSRADIVWVQSWVHAIFIVMWRNERGEHHSGINTQNAPTSEATRAVRDPFGDFPAQRDERSPSPPAVDEAQAARNAAVEAHFTQMEQRGDDGEVVYKDFTPKYETLSPVEYGAQSQDSYRQETDSGVVYHDFTPAPVGAQLAQSREEAPSSSVAHEVDEYLTNLSSPSPQISQTKFSFEGFASDKKRIFSPVEVSSTSCLEEYALADNVSNYRFDLFISQFEYILNEDLEEKEKINLNHGEIGYLDSSSRMRFKPIKDQKAFENAIMYLFTLSPGATLNFRFIKENGVDMRRRLEQEKTQRKLTAAKTGTKTQSNAKAAQGIRGGGSSPQFAKQKNTKAKIGSVQQELTPPPQPAPKRNSMIRSLLPVNDKRKSSLVPVSEFAPLEAAPQKAKTGRNTLMSLIKRAGRTKPSTAAKVTKVDHHEATRKRFEGLFEVESITRYTKGGNDDIATEIATAEARDKDGEPLDEASDSEEEEEESHEFMVNKLQSILTSTDLTHLHTHGLHSEWIACCSFFGIDPTQTGLDDTVPIFGLSTPLYQYQAFAVYWQMAKSRLFGGGFLADDPGLGKTLTYLAYIVVERQLSWLWNDVVESREKDDGRHLQEGSLQACPSAARFQNWIACPCSSYNPASKMVPKPGVRLAVVPDSLVESWKRAFGQYVVTDNVLEMRLVVASPNNNPPSSSGLNVLDSRHPTSIRALKADRNKRDSKGRHDDDTPHTGQERCLVITTAYYFKTWIKSFEYKATFASYDRNGAETWIKGVNPGIVFGIAMIDEYHEEGHWAKGTGRSGVLADLPKLNQPHLWGYSGTPFSTSPRALEGILWALESHYPKKNMSNRKSGWEESAGLVPFSNTIFDAMCTNFQALNQMQGKPDTQFQDKAKIFFDGFTYILRTFMLRRTAETSWFGRPLLALKPHVHADIGFDTNSFYSGSTLR